MATTLSAGLAKAKPAANSSLPSQNFHVSATSDYIHYQILMYKHFRPHVPSLYMPGLDDHIEGQRVYHNEFSRTYFNISILQTLTHRFILSFAAISWRKLRTKWDPSRHKHRRTRREGDARESPIDRMVDFGPISIFLFHHYSIICYRLLKGDLNGGLWVAAHSMRAGYRGRYPRLLLLLPKSDTNLDFTSLTLNLWTC